MAISYSFPDIGTSLAHVTVHDLQKSFSIEVSIIILYSLISMISRTESVFFKILKLKIFTIAERPTVIQVKVIRNQDV